MTLVWTIIVLSLIYLAVGVGAEFINDASEDEPFGFDKKSMSRILKWPKHIFGKKEN